MKITFLGTSHGVPRASRYCSSFMIESGDSVYLVDAGAPVTDIFQTSGRPLDSIRAIFTSHAHCDHTAGIPFLLNRMNWYLYRTNCDVFITTEELIDVIKATNVAWGDGELNPNKFRFHVPTEGVVFEDENIKAEYIKTMHTEPSYAILITEGEKRVLFGGDFSQDLKHNDVPAVAYEELDAFVCEMGHFGFDELDPHLRKCGAKQVLFTHVYPDGRFDEIRRMSERYPFPMRAPDDGDSIEI
ncbi:MAG: ribonuclease Z [Ruminococcaceae bacterium]|nr:ribonuclease Z [Oscillospiraceae bacterium]